MPNWKKLIVSGSDASLNSLNVTNNVTAQSFTGSFSGSFTAPGATTQVVYNNGGVLAANSGFVYSGSAIGIGTATPSSGTKLQVDGNIYSNSVGGNAFSINSVGANYGFILNNSANTFSLGYGSSLGTLGTSVLTWNSSGNVGIGTTTPAAVLHSLGTDIVNIVQSSNGVSYTQYYNTSTGGGGTSDGLTVGVNGTSGVIYLRENADLFFGTADTERMRITSTGNVGIGTSNPSTKFVVSNAGASGLEVDPTGGVSSGVLIQAYNRSTSAYMAQSYYALTHTFNVGSGAGTRALDITSAGNVGIGTTSPTSKLDVIGNSYISGSLSVKTTSTAGTGLTVGGSTVLLSFAEMQQGNAFYFYSSGNTYGSTITQNGQNLILTPDTNVGIGTTSPTAKLEVNGNVKATSFTGSFSGSFTAPGSTTQIVYNDNGVLAANSGLVYSGSNVGIGISSPTEKLHIVSSATGNQFARITATDSNASAAWVAQNDSGDNVVYRVFSSGVSGTQMGAALGRSASLLANLGGSGVFLLGTFSNTNFVLGTNNTENMRITTAGNVGIGTSSPTKRLHVRDTTSPYQINLQSDTSKVWATGVGISGYYQDWFLLSDGTSDIFRINAGYTEITNNIYASANIGIGTGSPSQKLEVQGQAQIGNDSVTSAGLFFARKNTNQAKSHYFLSAQESPTYQWIEGGYFTSELAGVSVANNSGKPYYESYAPAGQYKSFGFINQTTSGSSFTSTAATASMTLYQGGNIALAYNGGNVGIGTSSPGAKLQVVGGEIRVDAGQAITLDVANNMYLVGASNQLRLYNGGNPVVNITTGGNVGIGTTDPTSQMSGTFGIGIYNALYPAVGFKNSTTAWLWYGQDSTFRMWNATFGDILTANTSGNIGIGTSSPVYKLEVVGAVSASTYYGDGSNLTNIGSGSVSAAGSDGQLQYNNSGLFGGASRLYYNDTTNKVGIGTSSPGYDLDVSGSVRVQDKLRVGPINTGNGVIHQSSDATINASSSTIVWSVPGSSGAVAFIEYYIINTVTSTSQRGGNIVVTWNSAGTPQITHTETTTPDIGTTALVTFTTSITLGGDPQLVATNTSINPFYIVLNYRYF
jgi:hypothetical protein